MTEKNHFIIITSCVKIKLCDFFVIDEFKTLNIHDELLSNYLILHNISFLTNYNEWAMQNQKSYMMYEIPNDCKFL